MSRLLVRIFIKNHKDTKKPQVRESYGKLAGAVGIVTNLLLCIAKIIIGLLSSSIAIIADAINNLTDTSSSLITLIGFKLSAMPEDKDHPYGHARMEYLAGLFIAVGIITVGILLLKSSVEKIINPEALTFTWVTIIILFLSIIVKLWQAFFYRFMGKAIQSVALKAAFTDSRNDVITTTVILIGVIITKFTDLILDGILGTVVALFIIWSGIQLVRETASPLLGEAPDEELIQSIVDIIRDHEGVLGIHDLVVHNYGPGKIFASIHIEVDADGDLMESHDMVDNIEKEVSAALHIHFVTHMDPIKTDDPLLNEVSKILDRTIADMEGIDSFHDLRSVSGPTHTNIIFDLVVEPDSTWQEKDIHSRLEKAVQKEYPFCYLVITYDDSYTSLFLSEEKARK
ncbi:MAG: cation diffusion facilitator family transporter [Bacillota bacterium]|nr:cation diffusion facilitator family transporter [Bacillota bacterium]